MSVNIFKTLSTYMPKEDFVSNCLTLLFNLDKNLLNHVLSKCNINWTTNSSKIESQSEYGSDRIDIVIKEPKGIVFIENKIAEPDPEQLERYVKRLAQEKKKENLNRAWLILLSKQELSSKDEREIKDHGYRKGINFMVLKWLRLSYWIELYVKKANYEEPNAYKQFLNYLKEDLNIDPPSGFTKKNYSQAWKNLAEFWKNASTVIDGLKTRVLDLVGAKGFALYDYKSASYILEGRYYYGFSVVRKGVEKPYWHFEIFSGFQPEFKENEIYFMVELYLQPGFEGFLKQSSNFDYAKFKEKLEKSGFKKYDTSFCKEVELTQLIHGKDSLDEQEKAIFEFTEKSIKDLKKGGTLNKLREQDKKYS